MLFAARKLAALSLSYNLWVGGREYRRCIFFHVFCDQFFHVFYPTLFSKLFEVGVLGHIDTGGIRPSIQPSSLRFFAPASRQRVANPQLVKNPGHDKIDHIRDALRVGIEAWRGG